MLFVIATLIGYAITNITIATTDTWKDKNGEKQEKTEWHRVTFYRKLAEIAGEYLKKGKSIYIEGRLETRKWTDKQNVERYTTDIIATDMKMLGGGGKSDRGDSGHDGGFEQSKSSASARSQSRAPAAGGFDDMDDDIPF